MASHGREVKHTGDGIMASFDDVARALACAAAIQDGFDKRNASSEGPELLVRIGMAAGEPVDRGDDLFGSTVTLPAASATPPMAGRCWSRRSCTTSVPRRVFGSPRPHPGS